MHRGISLILTGVVQIAGLESGVFADGGKPIKPRRGFEPEKIRVSRKTTFLTRPLRKDGSVDFAAALNARASKGVTPESNAAVLIAQVVSRSELTADFQKHLYKALGIPKTVKPQKRFVSPWEFAKKIAGKKKPDADSLLKLLETTRTRLWSPKELPNVAAWLKQNRPALAVVRKAVHRPRWYSPIVHFGDDKRYNVLIATPIPLAQGSRDFGYALAAEATLAVHQGRIDDAIDNLRYCHCLARHVSSGHSVIEHLVGIAISRFANEATVAVLKSGKLTARQLDSMLASLLPMPSCVEKINLHERLAVLEAVIHVRRGGLLTLKLYSDLTDLSEWRARAGWAIFSSLVDWNRVLQFVNEEFDHAYAAVKATPYKKRQAAITAFRERRARSRLRIPSDADEVCWQFFNWGRFDWLVFTRIAGDLVTSLLMPALPQARYADDKLQVENELVRTAVALERYRKTHGKFPDHLSKLRPRFLKKIPVDLFAEKPFRYKRTKSGYLLHSVGPNMKDEQGKSPAPKSFGNDEPDDIALRVQSPK